MSRPRLITKTNNRGGIQGGISNGAYIYFTVGFKPPAISVCLKPQPDMTRLKVFWRLRGDMIHASSEGPSIVEAMSSLLLMDAQKAREGARDALVLNRRTAAE
jgi:chorismate synthase